MLASVGRPKCQTRRKSRCADCTCRSPADITPSAVSALRFGQSSSPKRRSQEIDVYSQPVDIFQLHNQQVKYSDIHQAAVRTLDNLKCHMGHTDPEKGFQDIHLSGSYPKEWIRKFRKRSAPLFLMVWHALIFLLNINTVHIWFPHGCSNVP